MRKIYLLSNQVVDDKDIEYLPIFKINFLNLDINIDYYDALVFTSKNGVKSLLNSKLRWKTIPSYAISDKTAKRLQEAKANLVFNANAKDGDEFALKLRTQLKDKKVLYIRAKTVVSNLETILKEAGIDCDSIISYETLCNTYCIEQKPSKGSIIIFSSPSSIDCFCQNFPLDKSYKIVVIGETTAKRLPSNIPYQISCEKSLLSCIKLAKTLI